jgi:hypothetical protein
MTKNKTILALITAFTFLLTSHAPSSAEIIKLTADLKGSEETPPTTTTGSGTFKGAYDTQTKKLNWTISYSGLSGPVTRADFHGPAGVGSYGSIKVSVIANHSPIVGSASLTESSEKPLDEALLNGSFYINLHTAAYPNGEVRGQILKEK